MTNPERIHAFLSQRRHVWFCDDCIADSEGIKPRQQVNPITATLGLTRDFEKLKGATCSRCGATTKFTTRSV